MKKMGSWISAILILAVFISGCAHPLAITNLSTYQASTFNSFETPLRVGVKSNCYEMDEKNLVKKIGEGLGKYNATVTSAVRPDNSNVDVVVTVDVNSDYNGSGWNFLINWPGFLIWTPAWHGYRYTVEHDVNILLTDAESGEIIDTFDIPVVLDVRHAAINRTWTEISWLEVSAIAFVGGVVFTQYDPSVTPLVSEKAAPVVGDYIAQEIVSRLRYRK